MSNRLLLHICFVALFVVQGCSRQPQVQVPGSSFQTGFSLEALMKENDSPAVKLCRSGTMGSIGGGGGNSSGTEKASSDRRQTFICQIKPTGESSFDEVAFIAALRPHLEKKITSTGAKVIEQGSSNPNAFFINYVQNDINGKVEIFGERRGSDFFMLEARIEEWRGEAKP